MGVLTFLPPLPLPPLKFKNLYLIIFRLKSHHRQLVYRSCLPVYIEESQRLSLINLIFYYFLDKDFSHKYQTSNAHQISSGLQRVSNAGEGSIFPSYRNLLLEPIGHQYLVSYYRIYSCAGINIFIYIQIGIYTHIYIYYA